MRVCLQAIFLGVEPELVHIFSSLHLLFKEVCALLKHLLGHFREDRPELGNDSGGYQVL